jgi:uncharacterized protein
MRGYRRFSNPGQMIVALAMFAALAILLESGGLYDWAQRLELGPERTVALPLATVLHDGLVHLGIEEQRHRMLVGLARVGWSDDPALLAAVDEKRSNVPGKPAVAQPGTTSPAAAGTPVVPAKPAGVATVHTAMTPLAGDPPIDSKLPVIAGVVAGHKRAVALTGDSMMAVGIASTILRQAPKYKGLTFISAYKSGTGLARPEVYNWQEQYPAMLKGVKPEMVLVAIGANDGQGFVDGGVTYPFGSVGWQEIYQARVEEFLRMLQADGATVIWLGLPPMKSGVYNAKIALVNRIAYSVVSATPNAIWYSTSGAVGDEHGAFRDIAEVNSRTVRLRQSDGIHLSEDGAGLVVEKLLPWLAAEQVNAAKPDAAKAAASQPEAPKELPN